MSSSAKIIVIGKTGQVATALAALINARFFGRGELDLSDIKSIQPFLQAHAANADYIINTAAYTAVDKAESEPDLCDKINHLAVAEMAKFCAENNKKLIHFSTDYVFDGSGNAAYLENATNLRPLNIYGKSKLDAEKAIAASGCKHLILRTSWVYNSAGNNFVKTMLKLGAEREEISVVNDQFGSPTYAPDIAASLLQMLDEEGICHFVPAQQISWFEFAHMIFSIAANLGFQLALKSLKAIPTIAYPTPAKRPRNSRLDTTKLQSLGVKFPQIEQSLTICLKNIHAQGKS